MSEDQSDGIVTNGILKIVFHKKEELLEEVVYPAALESMAQFTEDVTEMREQIRKQKDRLKELRIKKVEEPGAFQLIAASPVI